jgi:hypothetical protein
MAHKNSMQPERRSQAESAVAWFARLAYAWAVDDAKAAKEARGELARMGVSVRFRRAGGPRNAA